MREAPLKWLGLFYYIAAYILAIIGLLSYFLFAEAVIYCSLIFLPITGLVYSKSSSNRPHINLHNSVPKIWLGQCLLFLTVIISSILWFARFPHYGTTSANFANHLSLSLIFSSIFLSALLIMFTALMNRFQQPMSILLFFPHGNANERLAIYGNIWFRKATMTISLFVFLTAAFLLLPALNINATVLLISIVIISLLTKLPFFYRWLQIANKRLNLSFANILLLILLGIFILNILLSWFLKPFNLPASINLIQLGNTAPLIIFWGFAICATIALAYFLTPHLLHVSAKNILILCIFNPILWLITAWDFHAPLVNTLQNLPKTVIISISICVLILSYFWLNSFQLARLNALFFGNQGHSHQGPMPRVMVKNNLPIAFVILLSLILNAAFWLQVELFAISACVLISCFIACIIFVRMKL